MLFIQIPKAKIIEIEKRIEEKQRQKITVEVVLKFYLHNYQGDHPQTILDAYLVRCWSCMVLSLAYLFGLN